jgi:hypothetical protein
MKIASFLALANEFMQYNKSNFEESQSSENPNPIRMNMSNFDYEIERAIQKHNEEIERKKQARAKRRHTKKEEKKNVD